MTWEFSLGQIRMGASLAGASEPVRSTSGFVTGGLLPMLGVTPVHGRLLNPQDDSTNAPAGVARPNPNHAPITSHSPA
jgi:hypothetical protein